MHYSTLQNEQLVERSANLYGSTRSIPDALAGELKSPKQKRKEEKQKKEQRQYEAMYAKPKKKHKKSKKKKQKKAKAVLKL